MIKPSRRGEMVRFDPEYVLRPAEPLYEAHRVGPVAVPDCPFANGSSSAASNRVRKNSAFFISTLRDGPSGLLRVRQVLEIKNLILRSAPQERVSKDAEPF